MNNVILYNYQYVIVASFVATEFYNLTQQRAMVASFDATGLYSSIKLETMVAS